MKRLLVLMIVAFVATIAIGCAHSGNSLPTPDQLVGNEKTAFVVGTKEWKGATAILSDFCVTGAVFTQEQCDAFDRASEQFRTNAKKFYDCIYNNGGSGCVPLDLYRQMFDALSVLNTNAAHAQATKASTR